MRISVMSRSLWVTIASYSGKQLKKLPATFTVRPTEAAYARA
jgi:hypothetical protein